MLRPQLHINCDSNTVLREMGEHCIFQQFRATVEQWNLISWRWHQSWSNGRIALIIWEIPTIATQLYKVDFYPEVSAENEAGKLATSQHLIQIVKWTKVINMILCSRRFFSQDRINTPGQNTTYVIDLEIAPKSESTILSICEFYDVVFDTMPAEPLFKMTTNACDILIREVFWRKIPNITRLIWPVFCLGIRRPILCVQWAQESHLSEGIGWLFHIEPNYVSTSKVDTKQKLIWKLAAMVLGSPKRDQRLAEIK